MKKPFFWEKAKKVLIRKDKKLGKIISNYPTDFLFSKSDPFYTLARSIVGQQISVKAAQAVWDKLENKVERIEPNYISKMHFMSLKSCGLSRQKIKYLKSLSSSETVFGLDLPSRKMQPDPSKSNLTVAPRPVSFPSIPF